MALQKSMLMGRVFVSVLIVLCSRFLGAFASSSTLEKESERTNILAVPWSDLSFNSLQPPSFVPTCAFSVVPVHAEEEPTKGIFVQFKLGKYNYIARASLHNGKYCTIDVFRLDVLSTGIRFELIASTKLQYEPLGIKAASCDDTEAYIVVLITKDGIGSDVQLLVFKPVEPGNMEEYVIAHNAQLSGLKGVADISISCYKEQVIFAFAQSTTLSPSRPKEVTSSVHVWSPLSRSVISSMTADTVNSVSVVVFESGQCLMIIFAQNSNGGSGGPLDTLLYCLSSGSPTEWKLVLAQSLKLCEVNGMELYTNPKRELGLFVAISKKSSNFKFCPSTPLTMKWNGNEFVPIKNLTVKGVSDFYHFPSPCCNIVLAQHTGNERSLSVLGSSESLFEDVKKVDFLFVEDRSFFLISFSSSSHQTPLQEFVCDRRAGRKAKTAFGAGGTPVVPLEVGAGYGLPTPPLPPAADPAAYMTPPPIMPPEIPLVRNNRSGVLPPQMNMAGRVFNPLANITGPLNTSAVIYPNPSPFAPPKQMPVIRLESGVSSMVNRSRNGRVPRPYVYRLGKQNGTAVLRRPGVPNNKGIPVAAKVQVKPLVLQPKTLPVVHQERKVYSRVLNPNPQRPFPPGRNMTSGQRRKGPGVVRPVMQSGPVKLLPASQRMKPMPRIHYTDMSDISNEMAYVKISRPGLRNFSNDFDVQEKQQPFLPPITL
ncbi:uncharacterized protein LOC129584956 [Paramacrobiotus metropolitanus]|uniref:uncharacterized protein LOC129584956 n=1 Tax=Paramacrobiotus metropolitanus TaxID=2943436 RepID=UPI0024457D87|nr:uncharacterized protein LOC129584956 [Paramacrobiotus metropolitanus]